MSQKATITQYILPISESVVSGKRVAILPESLYERKQECPHCKSTARPIYLNDLQELPDHIADALRCSEEECGGVYIVVSHPRNYLSKPVFVNWEYNKKGESKSDSTGESGESS